VFLADSDAFHYVGYAESTDLIHWTVINGLSNPIGSVFPAKVSVNAQGVPAHWTRNLAGHHTCSHSGRRGRTGIHGRPGVRAQRHQI
jgi:hypothetical protein